MGKAGFCTVCNQNVYLSEDGGCINGHPSNCVTGVYDVPDAGAAPAQAASPLDATAAQAQSPLSAVPNAQPFGVNVPEKKKLSKGAVIGIAVGVILLCGVMSNLISGGDPEPTPAPRATESPKETKPAPAVTPEPEPEPVEDTTSADEQAYALEVASITTDAGEALGSLGRVLSDEPTAVFYDDDVKAEVIVYMATVKAGYLAAKELTPPTRMKGVHEDFLAAMKLYDQSMDKLARGIDNTDGDSINEALELMMKANDKLGSATTKMEALQ